MRRDEKVKIALTLILLAVMAWSVIPRRPSKPSLQTFSTRGLLATILRDLDAHFEKYNSFPPGGNIEIITALGGSNVWQGASWFNGKGEMIDAWGNPIVFRHTSEKTMMVHSVGKNGKDEMGKGDDLAGTTPRE